MLFCRVDMNEEYAFAVVLPQEECNHRRTHNFGDNTEDIRRALNGNNRTYVGTGQGTRVIAARPLEQRDRFNNIFTEHAEYRLLTNRRRIGQRVVLTSSHMSDLLNTWRNEQSCTVFFTLRSPCAGKCTVPNYRFNILQYLPVFNGLNHDSVAFVFQDIFHHDRNTLNRGQMLSLLRNIHEYGRNIPVFRCSSYWHQYKQRYIDRCFDCMANVNLWDNQCLNGINV